MGSSISGSVKIENAVDSATPREASELSQWYISLCMAVVAAQGMAVQMYSTLTTAAGRPVKRSSSTAAGKIISRSAHASSSFQSCRCAKRRSISRAPMTNMASGVVTLPIIDSASLMKPGSRQPVRNSTRPTSTAISDGFVSSFLG